MLLNKLTDRVLEALDCGVVVVDAAGGICLWNAWTERMSKAMAHQAMGKRLEEIWPRFAEGRYKKMMEQIRQSGESRFLAGLLHDGLYSGPFADGDDKVYNSRVEPLRSNGDDFLLIQITDVTLAAERIASLQGGLRKMAADYSEAKALHFRQHGFFDPVTGLYNRALLEERMEYVLAQAERGRQKVGLIYLALEYPPFSIAADGELANDLAVREAARRLQCCVRKSDTLARWDEQAFVLLLSHIRRSEDAGVVAQNISRAFRPTWTLHGEKIALKVQIGVSIFPDDDELPQALLDKARAAMLAAGAV